MSDEKKCCTKKPSSLKLKVKKLLGQRSRDSSKMKRRPLKMTDFSKKDGTSKHMRSKSMSVIKRKAQPRKSSGELTSRSLSHEGDSKSRMDSIARSIDLEEDMDPGTPSDVVTIAKREEIRETYEDEKKKHEKEDRRSENKSEKQRFESREESTVNTRVGGKVDARKTRRVRKKCWLGSEVSAKFFSHNNDIQKIRNEYHTLESLACNKTSTAFDANMEKNRDGSPKIYDDNRVKLNRSDPGSSDYINASHITMKDFHHKLIVAQLPQFEKECFVEDFWQMIYQEQIHLVYMMVPENALKNTRTIFFKEESGSYHYIGKMFVNNRKAEVSADPKEHVIEVLPEGNSDSVITRLHHLTSWEHLHQPPKTRPIITMIHQFLTEKQIQNANVCVVSVLGGGRACTFVGALYAINQLNNGIEPNIFELMKDIKQQRPLAVESLSQYAGVYAIVLDYISRKSGSKRNPINTEINRFIDELTDISPPVSPAKSKPTN